MFWGLGVGAGEFRAEKSCTLVLPIGGGWVGVRLKKSPEGGGCSGSGCGFPGYTTHLALRGLRGSSAGFATGLITGPLPASDKSKARPGARERRRGGRADEGGCCLIATEYAAALKI